MPTAPASDGRSSRSMNGASSAVRIGAEATRMPASEEEISSSPQLINRNGTATWTAASRTIGQNSARSPRIAPR